MTTEPADEVLKHTVGPTRVGRRDQLVDGLRGLALLGIVIVNVEFIMQHADIGWSKNTSAVDLAVRWFVVTFGELKIYPLFALLFGYGLAAQFDRALATGSPLRVRYARRMIALVILGAVHAVLFFPGDILIVYAAAGTIVFLMRRLPSASLIRAAVVIYAVASGVWLLVGTALALSGSSLDEPTSDAIAHTLADGSFGEVVNQHLTDWPTTLFFLALIQGPAAIAFMLAGMALRRTDILANPTRHRAAARRALIIVGPLGLIIGGIGAVLAIRGVEFGGLGFAISFLAAPPLSLAYVAALMLGWNRIPTRVRHLLQAAGRMSLSIYLLESVALSTLSYGFGLLGRLSPLGGVLLAISVGVALSIFASAWLRCARFGPAEWVLRSVTYWRIQPFRTTGTR